MFLSNPLLVEFNSLTAISLLDSFFQCESRLVLEHKTELQALVESLNTQHQDELHVFEKSHEATKLKYKNEIDRLENESKKQIEVFDWECAELKEGLKKQAAKFETEIGQLERKYKLECKQLEEDLTIAKVAAVNHIREEMQREKQASLSALEEQLKDEHSTEIQKVSALA